MLKSILIFVCLFSFFQTDAAASPEIIQDEEFPESREVSDSAMFRNKFRASDFAGPRKSNVFGTPAIWNAGSHTFSKTGPGQTDCITGKTCLTRSSVLYNSVVESPSGQQPCPGYEGPANTTWAIGDIADWNSLTYQPMFTTINCFPPGMLGVPMVVHLVSENIYLQVTFSAWQAGGSNFTYNRTTGPAAVSTTARFDFDGDSKTDPSIFRPGEGEWWLLRSSDFGNAAYRFGTSTDKLVPADYTGDGKSDIAFWRPSTGEWYVLRSEDGSYFSVPFGASGDIPAPGDFDGDGRADFAVFRPSTATWFINRSSDNVNVIQSFGTVEDRPAIADYDGDGMDDIAIFRPSVSEWWISRSLDGVIAYQFGSTGDKVVPGDFTGDGKADLAFWRNSGGAWFILRSEDNSFYSAPFGVSGDIPTAGDYDGDGTTDWSVFRPSENTWHILGSSSGYSQLVFGQSGDIPVPSVSVSP